MLLLAVHSGTATSLPTRFELTRMYGLEEPQRNCPLVVGGRPVPRTRRPCHASTETHESTRGPGCGSGGRTTGHFDIQQTLCTRGWRATRSAMQWWGTRSGAPPCGSCASGVAGEVGDDVVDLGKQLKVGPAALAVAAPFVNPAGETVTDVFESAARTPPGSEKRMWSPTSLAGARDARDSRRPRSWPGVWASSSGHVSLASLGGRSDPLRSGCHSTCPEAPGGKAAIGRTSVSAASGDCRHCAQAGRASGNLLSDGERHGGDVPPPGD